ncbi:hypothetical protein ES708_26835 [subsurface metagenome]
MNLLDCQGFFGACLFGLAQLLDELVVHDLEGADVTRAELLDSSKESLQPHDLIVGCIPIYRLYDVIVEGFKVVRYHLERIESLGELVQLPNRDHIHPVACGCKTLAFEQVEFHVFPGLNFIHDALGSPEALEKVGVNMLDRFEVKICHI